jgi:hypothetical protein
MKTTDGTTALIAYGFGQIAFDKGKKRIPCLDVNIMNMMEGLQVGEGIPLLNAWLNGWDMASAGAPIDEAETEDQE